MRTPVDVAALHGTSTGVHTRQSPGYESFQGPADGL